MKLYGLLGKNIAYSLSPAIHNAAFRALGMDARYDVFDREKNELEEFFRELKSRRIAGCNITIPHKEDSLEFMDECDSVAGDVGSVNTVFFEEGVLKGYNTDCYGFIKALTGKDVGDLGFNPRGKDAIVFGAGGAGRAVLESLLTLGIKKLAIVDIDTEKAERLANSISARRENTVITVIEDKDKQNEFVSKAHLLVNATSCGRKPEDEHLFDYRYITGDAHVFDLIYTADTSLVKKAKFRGAKAVNGLNMLLYQAAESFKIWTGIKNAPLAVMRKVVMGEISK
ncbi:MAG: shikimate dehydrogenase [Candidatus Omnitrophica bacterium]|nr:shikimate dehydrogenase [Candidatus Omnitrophota bacterium]